MSSLPRWPQTPTFLNCPIWQSSGNKYNLILPFYLLFSLQWVPLCWENKASLPQRSESSYCSLLCAPPSPTRQAGSGRVALNTQTGVQWNCATGSWISDLMPEDIKWPHRATKHRHRISGYRRRGNDCKDHVSRSALMMRRLLWTVNPLLLAEFLFYFCRWSLRLVFINSIIVFADMTPHWPSSLIKAY